MRFRGDGRNVVLTDPVPEGCTGQPLTINFHTIGHGQARPTSVTFKATWTVNPHPGDKKTFSNFPVNFAPAG